MVLVLELDFKLKITIMKNGENNKKRTSSLESTTGLLVKLINSSCLTKEKKLALTIALYEAISIPEQIKFHGLGNYVEDDFQCDDLSMSTW